MASRSNHAGALRSGRSCIAVQIALAWISGPDITWFAAAGVACTSWSAGAEAPTTTILPRILSSGTWPSRTSENDTVGIVPGGPR